MTGVTREALLGLRQRPEESVPVPELGDGMSVRVVGFTARERAQFETSLQGPKGKPSRSKIQQIRERLIVATCRDDEGNPLFTSDDIDALSQVSVTIVARLADAAQRVCGMGDSDVEDLAGN